MSLQIPIQKDIGEYEEKIVGKMSLRTLMCVIGGFGSAIAVACFLYLVLGIEVSNATLPVMAAALPFWLAGFWRPCSMKLEEFIPLFVAHYTKPQVMTFTPCLKGLPLDGTGPVKGHPSRKAKRAAKKKGAETYEPSEEVQ